MNQKRLQSNNSSRKALRAEERDMRHDLEIECGLGKRPNDFMIKAHVKAEQESSKGTERRHSITVNLEL